MNSRERSASVVKSGVREQKNKIDENEKEGEVKGVVCSWSRSALSSPGGCVQVVVDPRSRTGSLFDYGFFPVAGEYCS